MCNKQAKDNSSWWFLNLTSCDQTFKRDVITLKPDPFPKTFWNPWGFLSQCQLPNTKMLPWISLGRSNLCTEATITQWSMVNEYQMTHSFWHTGRSKGQPFCFYWPAMINLCMGATGIITCMIYTERKKRRKSRRIAEALCFSLN